MAASKKGLELSTQHSIDFDPLKCIICQRNTNITVTSTQNGRSKIIEAANLRKDIVSKRLSVTADDFFYHMSNECYKQYTLKKTLDKLREGKVHSKETEQPEEPSQLDEPPQKKTKSSIAPREEPSRIEHVHKQKCAICSKTQHSGTRDKFRISESPRADRFLQAARTIRQSLLPVDFGLGDRFGDAEELKSSWQLTPIPDNLLSFFSVLFNIKQTSLMSINPVDNEEDNSDDDESASTDIENEEQYSSQHEAQRTVTVKALYHMTSYSIHDGKKTTPLQLMTTHCVYDKCKSRELITSLNRIGVCVSYNEIQRSRKLLG